MPRKPPLEQYPAQEPAVASVPTEDPDTLPQIHRRYTVSVRGPLPGDAVELVTSAHAAAILRRESNTISPHAPHSEPAARGAR